MTGSVADVGKKGYLTGALDGGLELSLMLRAVSGDTAGKDLSGFADILAELSGILVVDIADLVLTENANFSSAAVGIHRTCCTGSALGFGLSIHLWFTP